MKTIDNLRQYFPVLTISLVLIAATLDAGAQNRRNNEKREKDRDNDRKEYRNHDHNDRGTANKDWQYKRRGSKDSRTYESHDYRYENHPQYFKNKKHGKPYYFNHPKYGRVYNRFDHNPLVFKHQHGDYYYYGNNFYRYHHGIGYCIVEPPRQIYFRHLPDDCHRVHVNGHVYFRHGDLYFQSSPRGYAIIPSPVDIQFSVRF